MKAYTIVDLGFGDAGKGTTIDYLSRLTPNTLIVRYNGGPQAAHNVVTAEGLHHTFAQFGSGTFVPTVKTYLSKYMWIDPLSMIKENEGLKQVGVRDAFSRLSIDVNTPIVTPFHKAANRVKEQANRHGSCGMGMGNAVSDSLEGLSLTVGALFTPKIALRILKSIQEKKVLESGYAYNLPEEMRVLYDPEAPQLCYEVYKYLLDNITVVDGLHIDGYDQLLFEGAGGILLDENYGFHPHTMWSTTTTENVSKIWSGETKTLGVIRTYSTRHGNGPFVSETKLPFFEPFNTTNEWQGAFRVGAFDLVATKYAIKVNGGIDALVVTHTDSYIPEICDAYNNLELTSPTNKGNLVEQQELTNKLFKCTPQLTKLKAPFIKEISERLNLPVFIESSGTTHLDKVMHIDK